MTYGINQPPPSNPSLYPFLVSDDVTRNLVQDIYLAFKDDDASLVFPFYLVWLKGFGSASPDVTGSPPAATHAQDVLIVDGIGTPVFSSPGAVGFQATDHGTNRTLTWFNGANILSLTYDLSVDADTPSEFTPTVELDTRNINQLPLRVNRLIIHEEVYVGEFIIAGGNNMDITATREGNVDGGRQRTQILFSATPGGGTGRTPGCENVNDAIFTINKVKPDAGGNFRLDTTGCYRLQRPGDLSLGVPRNFTLGGVDFAAAMQAQLSSQNSNYMEAGAIADYTESAEITGSTLHLTNDCTPCCECTDYEAVYRAILRVNAHLEYYGSIMEGVRDNYVNLIDRWNGQVECRKNKPQRLIVRNGYGCRVQVAGLFYNFTDCCVQDVVIRLTVRLLRGGSFITPSFNYFKPETFLAGLDTEYVEQYALPSVSDQVLEFYFSAQNPKSLSRFRTTLKFDGCQEGDAVLVAMTTHFPDKYDNNGVLCSPAIDGDIDAAITELWPSGDPARAFVESQTAVTPKSGYCCCD